MFVRYPFLTKEADQKSIKNSVSLLPYKNKEVVVFATLLYR